MYINLAGHKLSGFEVIKPHTAGLWEVVCCGCGVEQKQTSARLTQGNAVCKSSFHSQALANHSLLEMKRKVLVAADEKRKQAINQEEQDRADRVAQRREELAAEYRALVQWLLRNASAEVQDSFLSQIPLQEWLRGSDQNRELIVQIFKKERGE